MSQVVATIFAASITGSAALTVGVLAYVFGRLQKEHEVRFTRLYERRADVVATLYTLVHQLSVGFDTWRSHHNAGQVAERDQQNQPIRKKLDEFRDCYVEKDIWLSETTFKEARTFYEEISARWVDLDRPMREEEAEQVATDVSGWVESTLPTLKDGLRSEFQEVLGISGDRGQNEGDAIFRGRWRLLVGLMGLLSVGGSVGLILGYFIECYQVGILAGLLAGLGIGLFLEYLRPSRYWTSSD